MKLFVMLAFATFTATGADLSGNWLAKIAGPDGNVRKTYYDLKQDGSKVKGFMRSASFDRPVEGTVDEEGNVSLTSPAPAGANRPPMRTQGKAAG